MNNLTRKNIEEFAKDIVLGCCFANFLFTLGIILEAKFKEDKTPIPTVQIEVVQYLVSQTEFIG